MGKKLVFLFVGLGAIALIAATASAASYDIRIATGGDDFEERVPDNSMDSGSSDIEMPYENAGTPPTNPQIAGFRWALPLAKGAKINKAYVEFECDETKGGTSPVNLIIEGELTPNAPAFTTAAKDISDRPRTVAKVKWAFPDWTAADQKAQSADISSILTELVNQDGWVSGNSIVLIFSDDPENPSTGVRCAEAYEGEATAAALLHVEIFDPAAKDPNPANGAQEVTSPLLQWTAGDGAIAHQVYIGTSPTLGAADAAGGPIPMTMYFHVAGFVPGTTYYWRVDETAADGTVTTGPVWSFQAMPVAAWSPTPADGGVWLKNDTTVSWKAGSGAISHKVYGGTDKAAVAAGDASVLLATQAETSFALGKLAPLSVYYWRVDEVDPTGAVVPGSVWSFNVVGANVDSWRTAAADAQAGYLATYVADGLYDIGTFGDEQTYEFVVRSNPDEQEASMCLIGRRQFGDTQVGLKYEQWNNTGTYGATVFGVKDYDFGVPNAPGEFTHLVFVSSKAAVKTDLYVNGEFKGSVATAISLSGQVGIGYGAQGADASGSFDNFDGSIFGVAIYDRALSADEIAVNAAAFVQGGPAAVTLDIKIATGGDDTEEYVGTGGMSPTSSDLEMPYEDVVGDATDLQIIGLRWALPIPKGATITKAYVQFTCDETKSGDKPVNLIIDGQLIADAPAFTSTAKDLSSRTARTKAQVAWAVENWTTVGQKSQTPDLSALLQEIIGQDGWASGNAIALLISDDASNPSTGIRGADAFEDHSAANAPVLHIEAVVP
jgi:hypothetical protein